jgi:hypothetical protein
LKSDCGVLKKVKLLYAKSLGRLKSRVYGHHDFRILAVSDQHAFSLFSKSVTKSMNREDQSRMVFEKRKSLFHQDEGESPGAPRKRSFARTLGSVKTRFNRSRSAPDFSRSQEEPQSIANLADRARGGAKSGDREARESAFPAACTRIARAQTRRESDRHPGYPWTFEHRDHRSLRAR